MIALFKSQKKIIEQIHSEFDSAEDRLLSEANHIIQCLGLNVDHQKKEAQLAESLGFINIPLVRKAKKANETLEMNREQADLILYYKQNYPFQKFITEKELDRICEKYNLIHAPIANYIENVPSKNLNEIQLAPALKSNDTRENDYFIKIDRSYFGRTIPESFPRQFKLPDEIKDSYLNISHSASRWHLINSWACNGSDSSSFFIQDHSLITIPRSGFFIAAPPSHFDKTNLKKKGRFGYFNLLITEVKDPIVFRYVRGGVQIITKWGLEASDEALVNEINN